MSKITTLRELLAHDGDTFVIESYRALLGRVPDAGGMETALTFLRLKRRKVVYLYHLAGSQEAKSNAASQNLRQEISSFWISRYPVIGTFIERQRLKDNASLLWREGPSKIASYTTGILPYFRPRQSRQYDLEDFYNLYDERLVRAAYLALTGALPSPDAEIIYTRMLRDGMSRGVILHNIQTKPESVARGARVRGAALVTYCERVFRLPVLGHLCLMALYLPALPRLLKTIRKLENELHRKADSANERR